MQLKEVRERQIFDDQQKVEQAGSRIAELELKEMQMLSNLKNTVTEHNKLLGMAKDGSLDLNSVQASQQRFNPNRP